MSEITVSIGALAKPLAEQLASQGAKVDNVEKYDNNLNAVTRLLLCGYISQSAAKSARDRILKDVFKNMNPI